MLPQDLLTRIRSHDFRDKQASPLAAHVARDPHLVFLVHGDLATPFDGDLLSTWSFVKDELRGGFDIGTTLVDICAADTLASERGLSTATPDPILIDDKGTRQLCVAAEAELLSLQPQIQRALSAIARSLADLAADSSPPARELVALMLPAIQGDDGLSAYAASIHALADRTPGVLDGLCAVPTAAEVHTQMSRNRDDVLSQVQEVRDLLGERLTVKSMVDEYFNTLIPGGIPDTDSLEDILQHAAVLTDAADKAGERSLEDSRPYRVAMYGARKAGLDALEKHPYSEEARAAFMMGLLSGTKAIIEDVDARIADFNRGLIDLGSLCDFLLDALILAGCDERLTPDLVEHLQSVRRYRRISRGEVVQELRVLEQRIGTHRLLPDPDQDLCTTVRDYVQLRDRIGLVAQPSDVSAPDQWGSQQMSLAGRIALRLSRDEHSDHALDDALQVLRQAESLAGSYYRALVDRSERIAERLRQKMFEQRLDRAVIEVCRSCCRGIIEAVASEQPQASVYVLTHEELPELAMSSAGEFLGHEFPDQAVPLPPRDSDGHCSNALCCLSGTVVAERVLCFRTPPSVLLFFCAECGRAFCGPDLREVLVPHAEFEALPDDHVVKMIAMSRGELPFTYQCRRCGSFVGQGERTTIVTEKQLIRVND